MQSHFNSHTLPEIFRDLYLSERDGVLTLDRDGIRKRVFLRRGLFHYADSDQEQDGLGARLVERGRLSAGALEEARQNVGTTSELPHILLRRDLMAQDTLAEAVQDHVRSILCSVFEWPAGSAEFSDGAEAPYGVDCNVVDTCELFLQAILAMGDFRAIQEAMLGLDHTIRLRRKTVVPLERLTLSPAQGFALSRMDGSTTLRELVSMLPPNEEDSALRLFYGLVLLGAIDFTPQLGQGPFRVSNILRDHVERQQLEEVQSRTIEQAFKVMPGQDCHTLLGIVPGASRPVIERSYEEAKKEFGRDRLLPSVRERFRSELAVIESRLIEAYLKLIQPAPEDSASAGQAEDPAPGVNGVDGMLMRVELDKTQSKRAKEKAHGVAEGYFGQARKALREGDFHNAIQYGKLAISYNEKDARFHLLLAECQMRNPGARWQHLAEQSFARAIELDPWNADLLLALGQFYKRRGLNLRARKQFEEVLQLSPQNEIALAELQDLG